jgi:hypothetical protein
LVARFALILALGMGAVSTKDHAAGPETVRVSLVRDRDAGAPARYGMAKLKAALEARGIQCDEPANIPAARGRFIIVAGLASAAGPAAELAKSLEIGVPTAPESLLIRNVKWGGRPVLLLGGADDRGLMYSLLEVADRVGWGADVSHPLNEVRDTVESPAVADRGVTIFTMQQAQFEDRLHDANYWGRYLDMLARDRFNLFQVLFAYETDGYMCPAYPYFVDVDVFSGVGVEGLGKEQQQRNLEDLHRLIGMAHERGIKVTLGLWCHYYRFSRTFKPVSHAVPVKGKVFGLTEDNLIPYTRAALAKFLHAIPEVDNIQLLMHNESGLKTEEMKDFWQSIFRVMKEAGPNIQYEVRAKGVSDDLIEYGLNLGLKIRVNTKYWAEQVGLPFHPTHIQELNQFERRHSYSDMLKYPRDYQLHWTLWTSGTTRILLWGDPDYVRRFAGTLHLGGADGYDIMEPEATKMAGHPHTMKPFDLLTPGYRYYDYEFERYWHFFQVFGRLTYNPATPSEEWDHEFERRFGPQAAPYVEAGLHRASQILPHIVAYCLPPNRFPTTRGWPERQRQEDLPAYARAEPSDIEQFQSIAAAARQIVEGGASARVSPLATSRWFAQASNDVLRLAAEAEHRAGPNPGREFRSTMIDLRILANLALYHSRRIPAGLNYSLFTLTHDRNALDAAIEAERSAIEAWQGIVQAAGDAYNSDLMMGLPEFDLSGHWRDELVKLKAGLAALERERAEFYPEARRVVGRYDLGSGPVLPGYKRVGQGSASMFEKNGSNLFVLRVPDGRYEVNVGIRDENKSHGPMWIEVNGVEYTDTFSVPAGQEVHRTIETSAVEGKLKVLFDNATSADWYASTLVAMRVDPLIAHVPVRRLAPGQDLLLRATVTGVAPVPRVRVYYGDTVHGFNTAEMEHGEADEYHVAIPGAKVVDGLNYFLEAEDAAGRLSTWPEDGRANPVVVAVTSDDQPPVLHHTPILSASAGQPLRIVAQVEDPSGIRWVRLRYRGLSQHQDFQVLPMLPTGRNNEFDATIPAENSDPKFDLMYLIEAMDNRSNGRIYPDLAKKTPYVVVKVGHLAERGF